MDEKAVSKCCGAKFKTLRTYDWRFEIYECKKCGWPCEVIEIEEKDYKDEQVE